MPTLYWDPLLAKIRRGGHVIDIYVHGLVIGKSNEFS